MSDDHPLVAEARARRRQMLLTAFGPLIEAALEDPSVTDILANPDGRLWIDRADDGRSPTGHAISAAEAERIIRLVASHQRGEVHDAAPIVSAELPETGERFEGLLPPVAPAPCFAIRKPADVIYTLSDYVTAQIMGPIQARVLSEAVVDRKNIVVVGGTGSGKTTLVNALLAEVAPTGDRVVILEDTRELQCAADDVVALRTKPGVASLADLVRSTLRLRPDRIVVGEVRGPEALDMLKAWNTGHPGGITTVHANSDRGGLYRLEQLVQEAVLTVPRRLIAEAIDVLVFIEGRGAARKVRTVSAVIGSIPVTTTGSNRSLPSISTPSEDFLIAMTDLPPRPNSQACQAPASRRQAWRTALTTAAEAVTFSVLFAVPVHAAGSGMPWEGPLQQILESIEGPVAKIFAVIIIIITGLSLAFGDMSGGFRRLIQIVFGLSIAFAATSFFLSFFSFAGGAVIA